ncbi:MAG: peptide ABC transporter substrate-binding protein, partial [Bdellovibrionales bacterium]|nr:peptide ABC transporter substrate-binding protein [Bdellovibrionales bacterium]
MRHPYSTLALGLSLVWGISAGAVPQGGTMNLNLDAEPTTLNPVSSSDLYASQVQSYVMESLCEVNEDTYEIEPGLAEKCEASPDGKTFTFVLRQGLKWHDGQPITMEDVKFSYDVIFDNKFPTAHKRPYLEAIEKYEVLDPRTIRFTAKTKYFRNYDSIAALLSIVPKHIYSDSTKKGLGKELIGSGPYKLAEYEKGKRIVLEKHKDWWGYSDPRFKDKRNNVDKVIFRFVKEDSIQIEMLKKGDLDYMAMSPEIFEKKAVGEEFGKTILKVKTENKSPKPYGFVGWNLRNEMFQDKNVRIALAHLVNRPLMIEKFRFGMSLPATGPWYQQSEYANPNVKPIPFDVKKASDLLKKAGWVDSDKNGILDKTVGKEKREFRFQLIYGNQDTEKYWTMYKEDAKQAGVEIELKLVEWNTMVKLMDEGKFDA